MSFIKLDRALLNWRYAHDPNYVALWIHILLKVNYEPSEYEDVKLDKGECITSVRGLAEATGLSDQKVRTILKHLNGEELTIKSTNRFTQIKVNKWAKYQCSDGESNKEINKRLTNDQQTINNRIRSKENKKLRNIYIDALPVYDTSNNTRMSSEEEKELLSLMGRKYES